METRKQAVERFLRKGGTEADYQKTFTNGLTICLICRAHFENGTAKHLFYCPFEPTGEARETIARETKGN